MRNPFKRFDKEEVAQVEKTLKNVEEEINQVRKMMYQGRVAIKLSPSRYFKGRTKIQMLNPSSGTSGDYVGYYVFTNQTMRPEIRANPYPPPSNIDPPLQWAVFNVKKDYVAYDPVGSITVDDRLHFFCLVENVESVLKTVFDTECVWIP